MSGFFGGPVRAPLQRPGEDARKEIAQLFKTANETHQCNVSEPEADRGPRAGSPRGVVGATGS
jgi:hypothetical protein